MKRKTATWLALGVLVLVSAGGRTHSSPQQKPAIGNVPEGMYTIAGESSRRCIEVPNSSCATGFGLQIFGCDGSEASNNQKFNVTSDGAGYYTISPAHSDLCLEVSNDKIFDRLPIVQTECVPGKENQKWAMSQFGVNLEIRDVSSNRCLDVMLKAKSDSTPIYLRPCGNGSNQRWRLHRTTINNDQGVICRDSPVHPARNCSGTNNQQKEVHLGKTLTKARCEEACRVNKMVSCKWDGAK